MTNTNSEDKPNTEEGEHSPPNERPLDLPFGDWKEALAEFLERQDDEPDSKNRDKREGSNGDD